MIVSSKIPKEYVDLMFEEMSAMLNEKGHTGGTIQLYLEELKEFSLLRKTNLFDVDSEFTSEFHFDFNRILDEGYRGDPSLSRFSRPHGYTIAHTGKAKKLIKSMVNSYGTSIDGLSKIIMVWGGDVPKLFRTASLNGLSSKSEQAPLTGGHHNYYV